LANEAGHPLGVPDFAFHRAVQRILPVYLTFIWEYNHKYRLRICGWYFFLGRLCKLVGKVKWFSAGKGYGFIDQKDGEDVFVHYSAIEEKGFRFLESGELVEYEVVRSKDRLEAAHVVKLK
jgi:CspA family cold shock protein